MTISYATPPMSPELDPSSPFYPTLNSLAIFSQGRGLPRDLVHNFCPRRTSGNYGTAFGEDAKWVADSFPFAAAPDGQSSGYSLRSTAGTRSLNYPGGGLDTIAGIGGNNSGSSPPAGFTMF